MPDEIALRIGLRVEGNSDFDFLSALLPRLVPLLPEVTWAVTIGRYAARSQDIEAISTSLCAAYGEGAINLACIHGDADSRRRQDQAEGKLMSVCQAMQQRCALPETLCVPVLPFREIEAWALADLDALCAELGLSSLPAEWTKTLRDPEALVDPKQTLFDLFGSFRRRRSRSIPMASLGQSVGLQKMARCSSFTAMHERFAGACQEVARLRRPSSGRR